MDEQAQLELLAMQYGVTPEELLQLAAQQQAPQQAPVGGGDAPQPQQAPGVPQITVSPQPKRQFTPIDLEGLYQSYESQPTIYTDEIRKTREASAAQQKQLEEAIQASVKAQGGGGPSKSELYFKLAQTFLEPGKTGNFMEGVGRAAGVGAEYRKDQREARRQQATAEANANLEIGKLRVGQNRDDLTTLRTLDAAERQDRRAVQTKLLEQYIQSGKPQSDVGKEAVDAGFQKGTPEFEAFVQKRIKEKFESGMLYKEAMLGMQQAGLALRLDQASRLTPKEIDLKTTAEDKLSDGELALAYMDQVIQALESGQVFDGSWQDTGQYMITQGVNPDDPMVVATNDYRNLMTMEALPTLKSFFGPQISNADIDMMAILGGSKEASNEVRKKIAQRMKQRVKVDMLKQKKRLNELTRGAYRSTTTEPAAGAE